jgi:hypothetical protein
MHTGPKTQTHTPVQTCMHAPTHTNCQTDRHRQRNTESDGPDQTDRQTTR